MKKVMKVIKKLGNKVTHFCDILFEHIINTDFLLNHIMNFIWFVGTILNKSHFYKVYSETGKFSQMSINFSYYTLLVFFGLMLLYSGYLIYYTYYIKKMEEELSKEGYIKFLEDEYKTTYQPFLNGLGFFVTLLISFVALYLTLISMQISIDSVNNAGKIDFNKINAMFESLGAGLGITIVLFIICYFYYRWNIVSKNDYVKEKYYSVFKKS